MDEILGSGRLLPTCRPESLPAGLRAVAMTGRQEQGAHQVAKERSGAWSRKNIPWEPEKFYEPQNFNEQLDT